MAFSIPSNEIYLFLVTVDKYDKLRKIDGCKTLIDLTATKTDANYIIKIADNMKIPDENRFILHNPD